MIVIAASYARVSTPNQEEEDTIDSQSPTIKRYIYPQAQLLLGVQGLFAQYGLTIRFPGIVALRVA
jgi:hypothetical protein